ncbi:ABC transporter permease [Halorussus salinisoli]|uniref:ABC transporter permease n=1 Tax=Halorussus salinisoli TaxID=2558242 RepID=UPI0014855BF4|nr:ABC transporter permease [Halorussus salinisoli]
MTTDHSVIQAEPSLIDKVASNSRAVATNRTAQLGLVLLTPVFVGLVFAPFIAPHGFAEQHLIDRFVGPGSTYLLGTDHLGRDLFSRVLYGGRTSLYIGILATVIGASIGIPIGISSGYEGGYVDEFVMRVMDMMLSIPALLLALLILVTLSATATNAALAIGISTVPKIARVARSATLDVKDQEYITAAVARNESRPYIWGGIILPNITSALLVEIFIRIGFAIMTGAALSFLGLGAQPPKPEWGRMIAIARIHIFQTPWMLLWPSIALALTVLGFNLLGAGLRDALDPRETSREL